MPNAGSCLILLLALAGCASAAQPARPPGLGAARAAPPAVQLPAAARQGALVIGRTLPGSRVSVHGRDVRVAGDGRFVFAVPRDAVGRLAIGVHAPAGSSRAIQLTVTPRDWPVERIDGVPPSTVDPPPAIAARIRAEQARVAAVRTRDDARLDFAQAFIQPVQGRISGRFGNQRVYNGSAGAPHSGMDIAASNGTPVRAPAAGVVTFAESGLYLTGGTLVLDHGHGVSSNFLHLSRIDARVGDRLEQGEVLGAVGATGRATGPHLHWGMNWFDIRIDPLLVLEHR